MPLPPPSLTAALSCSCRVWCSKCLFFLGYPLCCVLDVLPTARPARSRLRLRAIPVFSPLSFRLRNPKSTMFSPNPFFFPFKGAFLFPWLSQNQPFVTPPHPLTSFSCFFFFIVQVTGTPPRLWCVSVFFASCLLSDSASLFSHVRGGLV